MPDMTLRPMTTGEVLDRTFSLYKSNFWLFVGIASMPYLVLVALFLVLGIFGVGIAGIAGLSKVGHTTPVVTPGLTAALGAGVILGVFFIVIVAFILVGAGHAATTFAVSDLYLGAATSVRSAYRRLGLKVFRIALLLFLVCVMIFSVFIAFFIVVALLRSPVRAVLGLLLLIVPIIILFCRVAVAIPVAMLEDASAVRALERSFHLTKGFAGQIFLIFLLVLVISYVAVIIFQMPFIILTVMSAVAHKEPSILLMILQQLSGLVSNILVGPIGAIAVSLMYYNLRVRKEAFDIQYLMATLEQPPAPPAPLAP